MINWEFIPLIPLWGDMGNYDLSGHIDDVQACCVACFHCAAAFDDQDQIAVNIMLDQPILGVMGPTYRIGCDMDWDKCRT